MKKIVINGCHECDFKEQYPYGINGISNGCGTGFNYICKKDGLLGIDKQVNSKTIHPDCSLENCKCEDIEKIKSQLLIAERQIEELIRK